MHPVPPVLDETRHVVQPFNRALQSEVGHRIPRNSCHLHTRALPAKLESGHLPLLTLHWRAASPRATVLLGWRICCVLPSC